MTPTHFAISRSIREAARFFDVCGEVYERGIELERCDGYSKIIGIKEGFRPSEEWTRALFEYYCALSGSIGDFIDQYGQGGEDEGLVDQAEVDAWRRSDDSDDEAPFARGGWAHRIVNVINASRRWNNVQIDKGDPEVYLMLATIRAEVNKRRASNGLPEI